MPSARAFGATKLPESITASAACLNGRTLLITGGTGTFGTAMTALALTAGARKVICYSRDEVKQAESRARFHDDPRLRFFLGDVRDAERLALAMQGVDFLVHAAAMKRIESCEQDPTEAVATNVRGTAFVARAAIAAGVERAVFLSTDKAPSAITLYGMTKAVAERLWNRSNVFVGAGPTRFAAVRYGNVLGSRGSVLDRWRAEYAANEPLTLTDERATRFWMPIRYALDIVLEAFGQMRGGETFIPKIGSAPILDLARAVVEHDGQPYTPGHRCVGLRPGERLHEILIAPDEARTTVDAGPFYVIEPEDVTWQREGQWQGVKDIPPDFSYRSDTNPGQLSPAALQSLLAT